jgi:hypothetical protein
MAINPSNSNAINIVNLPQAQVLTTGDLLIAETINGTQTIDFANLNVVKTDVFGNATIVGNLTGRNALLADVQINNLSAATISTSTGIGADAANDFYDRFTVENGIVLSASQNTTSNPVYTRITQTILPATTGYLLSLFSRIADESGYVIITKGLTKSNVISIPNFFNKYDWITGPNALSPSNFILVPTVFQNGDYYPSANIYNSSLQALALISNRITPKLPATASTLQESITGLMAIVPTLSAIPAVAGVMPDEILSDGSNNLNFNVTLPYLYPEDVRVYWRVLVTG